MTFFRIHYITENYIIRKFCTKCQINIMGKFFLYLARADAARWRKKRKIMDAAKGSIFSVFLLIPLPVI